LYRFWGFGIILSANASLSKLVIADFKVEKKIKFAFGITFDDRGLLTQCSNLSVGPLTLVSDE
jgi:hypothetical protein